MNLKLTKLTSLLRLSAALLFGLWFFFLTYQVSGGHSFYQRVELAYLDTLARISPSVDQRLDDRPTVVVVDLDEASLDVFGPWPWPRHLISELIDRTLKLGVTRLGVDIVFPDTHDPRQDLALSRVLSDPRIVLGHAFELQRTQQAPRVGVLVGGLDHVPQPALWPRAYGYVANSESIIQARPSLPDAWCAGHITPVLSEDGVVRGLVPYIQYGQHYYPSLSLAMLQCRAPQMADLHLKVSPQGVWMIPQVVDPQNIPVVSAKKILTGNLQNIDLSGKWVLLGSSALGVGDRVTTASNIGLPGVAVHAQALQALLLPSYNSNGEFNTKNASASQTLIPIRISNWAWLAWLYSMVIVSYSIWMAYAGKLTRVTGMVLFAMSLWFLLSLGLYVYGHYTWWVYPPLVCLFLLVIYIPSEWVVNARQNQVIFRRFGKYLAPHILQEVLTTSNEHILMPQRKRLTILFVDIANYTLIAEKMKPESLAQLTQEVLSDLTELIHHYSGTLDKFMGDAAMAFWGAPLDQKNQADLAVDCAIAMIERVANRSADWMERYELDEPLTVHIGINTGEVVVGEFGSELRKTYTAMGDAVNVAARLQEFAKTTGQTLLIGEETAKRVRRNPVSLLTHIQLRGKNKDNDVYILDAVRHHPAPKHT